MKFKKLGSMALCVGMLLSTGVTALANENVTEHVHKEGPSLYMDLIGRATVGVRFSGTELIANYVVTTPSSANVTQIQVDATIQQYKGGRWVTIGSEHRVINSYRADFSLYENVERGYKYRAFATVRACTDSYCETQSTGYTEAILN